jgi:hypothetical protein
MSKVLLADLDDLAQTVRDRSSRSYILEAVNAYRAEAFRSAIISTWTAVAYDIISKIRELAGQGDAEAAAFVTNLDNAIENHAEGDPEAVKRLQHIENELLNKSLGTFEFLSRQEFTDLDRLKQDRNLCAHPAFTKQDLLFQPTPERVRAHIVHAVDHLLQHPPVQGKNALARLKQDLLQPSFPPDQAAVSRFMRTKYLDHTKQSLITNFVAVFLKIVIRGAEPELRGKERAVVQCLAAVRDHSPGVYAATMAEQLPKMTADLQDSGLRRVVWLFALEPRAWGWLTDDIRIRLTSMITRFQHEGGADDYLFEGFAVDELKPHLIAVVERLDDEKKLELFKRSPRAEFVAPAFQLFREARSWRGAERLAEQVILPLSSFYKAEDISHLLEISRGNSEISDASGMPDLFTTLFKQTAHLHADSRASWEAFAREAHKTRYPFYALQRAMADAGMATPLAEDLTTASPEFSGDDWVDQ